MSFITSIIVIFLIKCFLPSTLTTSSSNLDYLDPETWTHLSQNILLHDLQESDDDLSLTKHPSDNHHIRHFTNNYQKTNNKNKNKKSKKGNRKGQRQYGNGNNNNNGSYKGKQGN